MSALPMVSRSTARSEALLRDPRCQIAEYRPDKLLSLVRMAERLGVDSRHWFDGLPFAAAQLVDPSLRVSYRSAHLFFARALQALHRPAAGLELGGQGDIGDFGLLGLAILTSRTLGEALTAAMDNYRVCGCMLELSLQPVRPGVLAIEARSPFADALLEPFFCDELFASCVSVTRRLAGDGFSPLRLELRRAAPGDVGDYARVFRCPLTFSARANRLLIDTRWLAHPLPGHNPLTARQALSLCAEGLAPEPGAGERQEIVVAVERLLRDRVDRHPRMADVAQLLNISERSLRRRLAESGVAFRDLHDRIRAEHALRLLHARDLSVAEVGVQVGFNDSREFRRAFKRWTGMAPTMARAGESPASADTQRQVA